MSNVYLNGFLLTLGLIMAIGAQNAHVLRQGLRGEHVLLTIGVSAACDILLIGLGIAGVGSLFVANPDLMTVARYGGAAFLVWYGTRALLSALRGGRALDLAEHRRMSRGHSGLGPGSSEGVAGTESSAIEMAPRVRSGSSMRAVRRRRRGVSYPPA